MEVQNKCNFFFAPFRRRCGRSKKISDGEKNFEIVRVFCVNYLATLSFFSSRLCCQVSYCFLVTLAMLFGSYKIYIFFLLGLVCSCCNLVGGSTFLKTLATLGFFFAAVVQGRSESLQFKCGSKGVVSRGEFYKTLFHSRFVVVAL